MTKVEVSGSTQRLVPVNPVWPYPPGPKSAPRGELWGVSMSQPRPRFWPAGVVPGSVIARTVRGPSSRCPFGARPPSRSVWAYTARSSAVPKSPA